MAPDTQVVHLFPFPPWGLHGGTMRLRSALEGTALDQPAVFYWWDAASQSWVGPSDLSAVGTKPPTSSKPGPSSAARPGLKRRVFPSTLFESARASFANGARLIDELSSDPSTAAVVLHTSYLAPLVAQPRETTWRCPIVVDIHDLVWLVHRVDARHGNLPTRAARWAYAKTVRLRELRALRQADAVVAAGWNDAAVLRRDAPSQTVTWVPVGMDRTDAATPAGPPWRLGIIGNFEHSATISARDGLLASQLAASAEVEVVLAGLHSDSTASRDRVRVLGPVGELRDFYEQIHATVLPVTNGSGMKCKLAEAALAGRLVITTPEGALGYPPELSRRFHVTDDISGLGVQELARLLVSEDPAQLVSAFEERVGRRAAASAYGEAVVAAITAHTRAS